jgi:uncharacterized RDD family membrane protein YckC/Tfp pilus assembly major pilin PilA
VAVPANELAHSPAALARVTPAGEYKDRLYLAGFWRRFAASVLDSFILWIPTAIIYFIAGVAFERRDDVASGVGMLGTIIVTWFYFAVLESSSGQATFGKRAFGIKVVDLSGERISFGRATGRHVSKLLSYFTLFIGFLMAGWTARKQALHDMTASCLVVARSASEQDIRDPSQAGTMPLSGAVIAVGVIIGMTIPAIGILAAIAIPAYQDYLKRSKVAEVAATVGACKSSVGEFIVERGRLPQSAEEAGCSVTPTTYVATLEVQGNVIGAQARNIDAAIDGSWVVMQAMSSDNLMRNGRETLTSWRCSTTAPPAAYKFLPASCRQDLLK